MNRTKLRARRASARGCHVHRRASWPIYATDLRKWDVFVEAESILGPRDLSLTYRQAVALAYSIAMAKRQRLVASAEWRASPQEIEALTNWAEDELAGGTYL